MIVEVMRQDFFGWQILPVHQAQTLGEVAGDLLADPGTAPVEDHNGMA